MKNMIDTVIEECKFYDNSKKKINSQQNAESNIIEEKENEKESMGLVSKTLVDSTDCELGNSYELNLDEMSLLIERLGRECTIKTRD